MKRVFDWKSGLAVAGWCLAAGLSPLYSQVSYKPGSNRCRITPDQIQPIIDTMNPFFCNHFWNDTEKTEIAQLDSDRFIQISQEGCVRHHAKIKLTLAREAVGLRYKDLKFYIDELNNVLNRLYYNEIDFYTYRYEFEKLLTQNLIEKGPNRKFDFHIADRTFVCELEAGDWGASLRIEIAKMIHTEALQLPGIKEYLDDGHFKPAKP
jgi:hypothetical protein